MVATAMEKIGLLGSRCLHFILAWPGGYLWASVGKQDAELCLVGSGGKWCCGRKEIPSAGKGITQASGLKNTAIQQLEWTFVSKC